jgi:RNA polymerase sigma-70 factor (ECF subfamily)
MTKAEYTECSDEQLFELMQADNSDAFEVLYNRLFYPLMNHAAHKVSNLQEAQDIVQDLFVTIWKKRRQIIIQGKVVNFLFVSLRNSIINFYIKNRKKDQREELFHYFNGFFEATTERTIHKNELEKIIQNEIDALPEKMREIYLLSRNKSLSHKQIAELLELSEHTVKKQVSNALRILKQKINYTLLSLM